MSTILPAPRRISVLLATSVLCSLAASCGDTASTADDTGSDLVVVDVDDSGTDLGDDTSDTDDAEDTGSEVGEDADDTGDPDGGPDAGLDDGELCLEDSECASRVCVRFDLSADQGFCTSFCFEDGDCADGDDCVFFVNSGGDAVRVCIPSDLCVDGDEDGYGLGSGCDGGDCDDSDASINPAAAEVCDGIDNDCDGFVDDNAVGVGDACDTGFPGTCAVGRLACVGGTELCESDRVANAEVCDGIDNDCDGRVDEDADGDPLSALCYGGPRDTEGTGQCVGGVRVCEDGSYGVCLGQVLPFPEICDGLDNDCDGVEDEDAIGGTARCDTGLEGVCALGFAGCGEGSDTCVQVNDPAPEACDGLDNDCDGRIDEGPDGEPLGRVCYEGPEDTLGVGTCVSGVQVCSDGDFGPCIGDSPPGIELCDGLDNDCDTVEDEGAVGGGASCATGLPGICALGVAACETGGETGCVPVLEPVAEICDGLDNDCDGETDESVDGTPLARACYGGAPDTRGEGICSDGVETCVGGIWSSCVDQVLPSFEICDGEDNDCDGDEDEGNPGGDARCDTGEEGVCADGVTECVDGSIACSAVTDGDPEVCDGRDNDCDGVIDENAEGTPLQRVCYEGDPDLIGVGLCVAGTQTCQSGEYGACLGDVVPTTEICDGEDNDCDGEEDEGAIGGGTCSTGRPGVCALGVLECGDEGASGCTAIIEASSEICDGLDNDCDGEVDEADGGTPLARDCYDGPDGTVDIGLCQGGTETCVAGEWSSCSGQVQPSTEICDGLDNNCDGDRDELNPGGGVTCATGGLGACARGVTECGSDGSLDCVALLEASTEVCDGIDNDCDGEVDEGVDGAPLSRGCYDGPDGTDGIGLCHGGTETCVGGEWSSCSGQVLPATEVCDGQDNNCDGSEDELNPGGGIACATGELGACSRGVTACRGDGTLVCVGLLNESAEVCDGIDNDCDGDIDEDELGADLTRDCYDGPDDTQGIGLCSDGVETCVAGSWSSCADQVLPSFELCDGEDNDCDGDEDESNPEGGVSCDTGDLGVCARGVTACVGDGVVDCVPLFAEEPESCDGFDNDCDGETDEAEPGVPLTRDCYDGPDGTEDVGSCVGGTATCRFGDYGGCVGQIIPVTEVCDYQDNDCDDEVDEGALLEFFLDADRDGFGDPDTIVLACEGAGYVTNGDDCYDGNSAANPEQEGYFGADRGDGSFDYDCDDEETSFFGGYGTCSSDPPLCYLIQEGWLDDGSGTMPACGETGIYIFDCLGNGANCDPTTATTTQRCR